MSETKKYMIDEKHISELEEVLSMLAIGECEESFLLLDGILTDILNWCEVKEWTKYKLFKNIMIIWWTC